MSGPAPTFHKLGEFEPTTAQNKHMLGHWKSLRDDRQVPLWQSFDPLNIIEGLENCAIVEFVNADLIKIRLFGNALVERLGEDLTGGNLLDIFEPDQRLGVKERTRLLRTRPAVLRSIIAAQSSMGVPIVAESMLFPFCNEGGAIDRGLLSISELDADEHPSPAPQVNKGSTDLLQSDVLDL